MTHVADTLRYFRVEAKEIVERLEQTLVGYVAHPESLSELFRLAHTLKGSARVVHAGAIADLAHAMEDVLSHHGDAGTTLSQQEITELLQVVDGIRSLLRELPSEQEAAGAAAASTAGERELDAVRIGLGEMDELAAGLLEAQSLAESLREQVEALRGQERMRLTTVVDSLELELGRLVRQTSVLRLLDASAAFPELERAARDAAAATGKQVAFRTKGGSVKIDGHVLSPLRAALLHLVRNAVAHGIEAPALRGAAGKAETGTLEVSVERRGSRIAFVVRDDGAGIDHGAVRRIAAARGIAPSGTADDTSDLIFEPGLSTASEVTDLAGRGVGLDIVRSTVRRLKGELRVSTESGSGASFELVVPVSLSAIRVLAMAVADRVLLVPLDTIVATARLGPTSLAVGGDESTLLHDGAALPFRSLADWLGSTERRSPRIAVIVRTTGGHVGIAADALLGTRDVVVRPLPRAAGASPLVAGVAFDSHGDPELVLDPEGLLAVSAMGDTSDADGAVARRILVIDDSLTTRMLEQSILEAAGYEVDVASSAEEGLAKAKGALYGLIVVDVEMPGMNGYQFTEETRRDPKLQAIPVVMVTSLASEESRRRGKEAGASAYIVKGEFNQGGFLRTIGELLG